LRCGSLRAEAIGLHWTAFFVEEHGRDLADSFLTAARQGDWRAADALMNRIYGSRSKHS
jgi:hypothetical protein